MKSIEPTGVKLTIDYHIQKIVEKVLDQEGIKWSSYSCQM